VWRVSLEDFRKSSAILPVNPVNLHVLAVTPDQLAAICNSFDKALSMAPDFGARFYQRLSRDHPQTLVIFSAVNMASQHTRFVGMLSIVLHRMKDNRPVTPLLQDLGRQHGRYGVRDEHFEGFGAALIEVVSELLGSEFDAAIRQSWIEVYEEITGRMKSGRDTSR
jgi:hemoglobin-like flavoprotein